MTKAHKIDGLKNGMVLHSKRDVARLIGYTNSKNAKAIQCALKHYCEFHADRQGNYYIDNVFDEPLPFKSGFLHEIGETITTSNSTYKIIDRYVKRYIENGRERTRTVYLCKCLNDGYEFERQEGQIERDYGCPLCAQKVAVLGHNTIFDLRKDLIKYFVDIEDTKNHMVNSNEYVWMKCPVCGTKKFMSICNLSQHGFSCSYCSDGLSYVNKFVRNMLNQLNINFEAECHFNWSNGRIYDQYLEDYNMIIENHGEQHYGHKFNNINDDRDDMAIDKEKRELAIKNGITYYIELDCRESTIEFIKNSVMKSILSNILKFSDNDVNWEKCGEFASSSLMHKVWDCWNQCMPLKEIQYITGLSLTTIESYVQRGNEIGKIKYRFVKDNPDYKTQKGVPTSKPIYCVTDDIYFASSRVASNYYKSKGMEYINSSIGRSANTNKPYRNKQFTHITKQEFNDYYDKAQIDSNIKVVGDKFPVYFLTKETQHAA